ncbi:MAG: 3-oxoacyl-[acyl-carrier-protein] synthase II [Polyangiales bacterium]|jgi:3-oxoacyl-[acyl-carrier-protein] synthase II
MKLALTGYSVVSTLGVGRIAWENALRSDADLATVAFSPASEVAPGRRVAEVWNWDPAAHLGAKGHRTFDRLTKFLIAAASSALLDAGVKRDGDFLHENLGTYDVGVCSATAYGSLDAIAELNRVAELEDPRYINPQRFPNTVINAAAGYVSIWEKLAAPNTTVVDGNCGALDAFLVADTQLRHQRGNAFVVGGGEVASEPLMLALKKLGLMEQGGLAVGEGAAFFVAERLADAEARGAKILGEVVGYGSAFDPPESDALLVHGSARALADAIRLALADAHLETCDIDLVVCSESGLSTFDDAEKSALGDLGLLECVALRPKSWIGETFGASGAFGVASALTAMNGGMQHRMNGASPARHVVVTTLGYYGNASAVILRQNGTR